MATKKNISSKNKQFEPSSTDLENLINRVESPISIWLNTKDYRLKSLTTKKAAIRIGINVDDFRFYLKYVVKGSLSALLGARRVEEAKQLMFTKGGVLNDNEFMRIGFADLADYYYTFNKVEGVLPSTWINRERSNNNSSYHIISNEIKQKMEKVRKALIFWERNMGYREPGLTDHNVAKALGVDDDDLFYYCCIELHDTIHNWIEKQRIYDAKLLLQSDPQMSIDDIRSLLGYRYASSLKKSYEKITGAIPEAWKENSQPKLTKTADTSANITRLPFDIEPIIQWKRKKGFCQPNLTQKDVAKDVGFSDKRFADYLKQVEKRIFTDWISLLRIDEAKRLLSTDSSLTLSEIARKVGLSGNGKFRSLFWKYTGQSPESWLESLVQENNNDR